jgi:hypothetical protein
VSARRRFRPREASLLLLFVLPGLDACSGDKAAGAAGLVAIGAIGSGISRASGGCLAICAGDQVCNTATGFCERNACGTSCGPGLHCDIWGPVPRCVEDPSADLVSRPPPKDSVLKPIP